MVSDPARHSAGSVSRNQSNLRHVCRVCETSPAASDWFQFLIIPRDVGRSEFWLFSKAAQGGSGELVTAPEGNRDLRQWAFTGKSWQCFDITPLPSYDRDRMVRLSLVDDSRVVSTRWSSQAFLWDLTAGDKQQMLHLEDGGPIPLPRIPEIEGVLGTMDRELLRSRALTRQRWSSRRQRGSSQLS